MSLLCSCSLACCVTIIAKPRLNRNTLQIFCEQNNSAKSNVQQPLFCFKVHATTNQPQVSSTGNVAERGTKRLSDGERMQEKALSWNVNTDSNQQPNKRTCCLSSSTPVSAVAHPVISFEQAKEKRDKVQSAHVSAPTAIVTPKTTNIVLRAAEQRQTNWRQSSTTKPRTKPRTKPAPTSPNVCVQCKTTMGARQGFRLLDFLYCSHRCKKTHEKTGAFLQSRKAAERMSTAWYGS